MLSNKMTVSLMSLITIFALAFVVSPAMAVDFEVMIEGPRVVTYTTDADGDVSSANIEIDLLVTSEEALLEPLTTGTVTDGALEADTANITGEIRDSRGFITNIWADARVTVADDLVATFAARTVKQRQLSVTIDPQTADGDPIIDQISITIPAFETPDTRVGDAHDMSIAVTHTILVRHENDVNYDADDAKVVSIQRLRPGSQAAVAAFQDEEIKPDPFDVRVVLTEMRFDRIALADRTPDELAADLVSVGGGEASNLRVGTPFTRQGTDANAPNTTLPHPDEGRYANTVTNAKTGLPPFVNVPMPTGLDNMYHEYRVTITPQKRRGDYTLTVSVNGFGSYSPTLIDRKPNGREQLRIPVARDLRDLEAGYRVTIGNNIVIPAGGYLIIARSMFDSQIVIPPGRIDRSPMAHERRPAQMLYNIISHGGLPNLSDDFHSGVVIDVEYGTDLVISEVMWGTDSSLTYSPWSQWIELYNPGDEHTTAGDDAATFDVDERLTLVFYAANEFGAIPAKTDVAATATTAATTELPDRVVDRIGTLDETGAYWSPATKGQSGVSGIPHERFALEVGAIDIERTIAPAAAIVPIVSMYRVMEADGTIDATTGQMAASWMRSEGPKSANFNPRAVGTRHGTPGAPTDATDTPADTEAAEQAEADAAQAEADRIASTGTIPKDGKIYVSEIMVAGGGVLPQWIEIANGSRTEEVNLSGWTLTVDNAVADADVSVGSQATFTIADGTMISPSGQQNSASTILVVSEAGRNNVDQSGQVINLWTDNEVDLINAGVTRRKYTLLSADAFLITLSPPEPEAVDPPAGETAAAKAKREADAKKAKVERMAASDMVGNLGADGAAAWVLPMSEDGRSSIIRRHIQIAVRPSEPEDGTMADNWTLASETAFAHPTHIRTQTYYGAMNDVGTPGFRAGGALPVELSHFRPERQKDTGAVVITWSTQSELNNAGFFIKRSQQKDGEFKVINATMVPGAGTTSEKQFYTYTDTTAQPNVVYYYQIEDVSLDGQRQTLTRGIRLKGHVGAAGKATITWGELKTSHE